MDGQDLKFATIVRKASRLWRRGAIRISDGYPAGNGGYLFPSLSAAYDAADDRAVAADRAKESTASELVVIMVWTMFGELHAEAVRRLKGGRARRRLRLSELDKSRLADRFVEDISVKGWTKGWRRKRSEFLLDNPEIIGGRTRRRGKTG